MQQERVEGHWRLELPDSETSFRVWRFAVNSSGPSFDQLEVAWRKCNDPGSSLARDNQDDVFDIFSDSCAAIVQPGSGPGPRSLSALRELWVFTTSDAGARVARHNVKNLLGKLQGNWVLTFRTAADRRTPVSFLDGSMPAGPCELRTLVSVHASNAATFEECCKA